MYILLLILFTITLYIAIRNLPFPRVFSKLQLNLAQFVICVTLPFLFGLGKISMLLLAVASAVYLAWPAKDKGVK